MNIHAIAKQIRAFAEKLEAEAKPDPYAELKEAQPEAPPFTLPTPPPGMQWHRTDGWTAEMLPPWTRPLVKGEVRIPGDSIWRNGWQTVKREGLYHWKNPCNEESYHSRTSRPLTFTHEGETWTWHRSGEKCPRVEKRAVQVLLSDGSVNRDPAMPEFWDWEGESPDEVKIIGWRYASTLLPIQTLAQDQVQATSEMRDAASKVLTEELESNQPDDSPPWIEWHGGECPLKDEEVEEWQIKYRTGNIDFNPKPPSEFRWEHESKPGDIIAYRVLKTRAPKPKVPLGPEDVPPGSVLRRISWHQEWLSVSQMTAAFIVVLGNEEHIIFEDMVSEYEINRSIPLAGRWNPDAWEPCHKEAKQ